MPLDQQTDILARMSGEDREALLSLGTMQRFSKGEFVFRAGAPGKHVYFLRKGRVKICQPSHTGKEVILWFCFAGEMFGLAEVAQGEDAWCMRTCARHRRCLNCRKASFPGFFATILIPCISSCRYCRAVCVP